MASDKEQVVCCKLVDEWHSLTTQSKAREKGGGPTGVGSPCGCQTGACVEWAGAARPGPARRQPLALSAIWPGTVIYSLRMLSTAFFAPMGPATSPPRPRHDPACRWLSLDTAPRPPSPGASRRDRQ